MILSTLQPHLQPPHQLLALLLLTLYVKVDKVVSKKRDTLYVCAHTCMRGVAGSNKLTTLQLRHKSLIMNDDEVHIDFQPCCQPRKKRGN